MRISDWSSDVCSSDLFVFRRWSHLVFKDAHTFLAHFLFHEVAGAVIAFCHVLSPFIAGGPASRLCEDCPAPKVAAGSLVPMPRGKIGRASCRARVCKSV